MSKDHISPALRARIEEQAHYRCGYCLRTQELLGLRLTLDHIIPEAAGGPTAEDNLWLACRRCNEFKGVHTHAVDPQTGERVPLFNPRRQVWGEHFAWDEPGVSIVGKTVCGRATVVALQLNNPEIVVTRRLWVSAGWWPPRD